MNNKIRMILGCLAITALPSGFAGDTGGLRQMDANGDSRITLAEYLAEVHVRFDKLDTNRDGVIAADELYSVQEPRRSGRIRTGSRAETGNLAVSVKLGPADQNGDGQISRAENDADAEAHFAAMDTDKDGVLTQYELDTASRR